MKTQFSNHEADRLLFMTQRVNSFLSGESRIKATQRALMTNDFFRCYKYLFLKLRYLACVKFSSAFWGRLRLPRRPTYGREESARPSSAFFFDQTREPPRLCKFASGNPLPGPKKKAWQKKKCRIRGFRACGREEPTGTPKARKLTSGNPYSAAPAQELSPKKLHQKLCWVFLLFIFWGFKGALFRFPLHRRHPRGLWRAYAEQAPTLAAGTARQKRPPWFVYSSVSPQSRGV